jgi:ApbE superfamily uncharacterized protein (UPF0280 family)
MKAACANVGGTSCRKSGFATVGMTSFGAALSLAVVARDGGTADPSAALLMNNLRMRQRNKLEAEG